MSPEGFILVLFLLLYAIFKDIRSLLCSLLIDKYCFTAIVIFDLPDIREVRFYAG